MVQPERKGVQVDVSGDAAQYIRARGGHVVVFVGTLSGCCGGTVPSPPVLEVGKPRRNPRDYEAIQVAGITVHVENRVSTGWRTVRITLDRALWWKTLSIEARGHGSWNLRDQQS